MDLKVKQDTYNPLLKRKEVSLEVEHEGQGTPSRVDLRKAVASKFSTKPENVYVIDVETKTGTQNALCQVEVYEDAETAQQTVPKYIRIRNLPPDERKQVREQEAKKEEAKPKAAKPAEGKPEAKVAKQEEGKEAKPKETKAPEAPKKSKEPEAK
ncbi:MAG TPA: 30S ribosomal protein S24 [archaeon]|nr:30S ribosomal protein S24 [archaeon]